MKLRYLTLRFISISRIFFFWKIKCKWHSRILFYFYRKSTATLVWYLHWSTLLRKSSFCTMHLATWSLAQRMWTILWIFKICYWIERDFGDGTTLFTLNWHKVQTGPKSFRGKKKSEGFRGILFNFAKRKKHLEKLKKKNCIRKNSRKKNNRKNFKWKSF